MDWPLDINLENMVACGAPFGGPIALTRDPKQLIQVKGSTKPVIRVCNSVGTLVSAFQVNTLISALKISKFNEYLLKWKHGNLLAMGWSDSEELLCVQDDGLVVIYNMFGEEQHTFSMGKEANSTKV